MRAAAVNAPTEARGESRWLDSLLWLPLLIALAVGIPTYLVLTRSQENALESQLQATLRANRESLQLWLDGEWQRARHRIDAAGLPALLASGKPTPLEHKLLELEQELQAQAVTLISVEGHVLASTTQWPRGLDFTQAAGLTRLRRGDNTVLGVQRRGPGHPAWISLALPLESGSGQPIHHALLVHRLAGSGFSRTLAVARIGSSGESYAFGPEGELFSESRFPDHLHQIGLLPTELNSAILHLRLGDPGVNLVNAERSRLAPANWPLTHMAQEAIAGRSGSDVQGYRDYRGVRVVGAWQWLDELGLGLATEIDLDEAYKPVEVVARGLGLLLLLLAVGSLLLAWLRRGQTRQRSELARAARELEIEIKVRREAEHERELALLQAEHAARAKTRFLATMSHEIRTPMNDLQGYVQLLQRDGALGAEPRHKVNAIARAGQHLMGLINSVLDMARIESGQIELQEEAFDLAELLRGLDELFELRCRHQSLGWKLDLRIPSPCPVRADRHKLNQVLIQLIGNALKFARLRVELRAESLGQQRYRFLVRDDGPGLPEDEAEHLFEPFHQGEAGSAKGGPGLGLAITRGLVQAMGGRVRLRNIDPGCEANVELWLQTAPELALKAAQQPPRGRVDRPVRALVVDDNDDNRRVLAEALNSLGITTEQAADGEQGCEKAMAAPPDIIFMDLRMPRLDGIQALKRLRAEPRTGQLPIVAVSASSLTMRRDDFLAAGFDDAVSKPFMLADVVATLGRLLGVRLVELQPAGQDLALGAGRAAAP
ncbi:response regulator [Pelomonas sp. SE-A7]|uniref:response regulator n=1 Tax=Pelomonas sp. SE-A7 TaxID=3054953 RepID=UPI00259CA26B|nr:response regulator [Pelomonas sp. SE-A7]MDM4764450.1 response regulator [Pelomonas sp. SE-A7]